MRGFTELFAAGRDRRVPSSGRMLGRLSTRLSADLESYLVDFLDSSFLLSSETAARTHT